MSEAPLDSLGPGEVLFGGLFDEITDALLIIESDGGRILCSNREAQRLLDKGRSNSRAVLSSY